MASLGGRLLRRLNAYEQIVRFSIASTQLVAAQASGGEDSTVLPIAARDLSMCLLAESTGPLKSGLPTQRGPRAFGTIISNLSRKPNTDCISILTQAIPRLWSGLLLPWFCHVTESGPAPCTIGGVPSGPGAAVAAEAGAALTAIAGAVVASGAPAKSSNADGSGLTDSSNGGALPS